MRWTALQWYHSHWPAEMGRGLQQVEDGLQEGLQGHFWLLAHNAALLNCCSRFSTAPPMCCCTVMHYDGGLRFSSISPGCNEFGGGRGPPALPSGVVQEFGPPGWVAPITAMEGSSRGGPGWPRPAGSYWEFSSLEMRRSSSSPNSPPIRLGSPTTITSWNKQVQLFWKKISKVGWFSFQDEHIPYRPQQKSIPDITKQATKSPWPPRSGSYLGS